MRRARPGDLVAVHGMGGLGHLRVQFARHMGFRVAAIARGADKAPLASQLGAHHYIDSGAEDPMEVDTAQLTFGTRGLQGSLTGSPIDDEDTLDFSVLQNIRPMIETMKLEQAAEAYGRMMRGDTRFRMVLVMGQ
jgi:propanol-preferring alcohol dehydrogenase